MKRNLPLSALALVILILASVGYPGESRAANQCINSNAPNPLEVCVDDTGTPSLYLNQPNGRVYQYYGTNAWGSAIWLDGANTSQVYDTGNYGTTIVTPVSNTLTGTGVASDPYVITTEVLLGSSGVQLVQKLTYVNGDRSLQKTWSLSNTGSTTFNDVRFFHGGDTYFGGNDSARGWYDASTGMVYVTNSTFTNTGYMGFFPNPATPASRYFAGNLNGIYTPFTSTGQLANTASSNYVDAGFALQWNRATLAPGESWSFEGFEIYTPPGILQVLPPNGDYTTPGAALHPVFKVQNFGGTTQPVNVSIAGSPNGWPATVAVASPVLIGTQAVASIPIDVNVPLSALAGQTESLALTVSSGANNNVGRTRFTILDPQFTLSPTTVALSAASGGSSDQVITLTNGASAPSVQVGAVGATNALAAPFTLISDTCSNQTVAAGASCTVTVRYTPSGPGAAADSFSFPILSPIITTQTISVSGDVPPHNITATAATGGTITPTSATVADGATQTFTVTANAGFTTASVSGCGGVLAGTTYTTAAVTADCLVIATFSSNGPVFSIPSGTIERINSSSLFTPYPANLKPTAVDSNGNAVEVTLLSGDALLTPGTHTLTWRAVDGLGVATTIQQIVNVAPTVSVGRDVSVGFVQGQTGSFRIALNGPSADAPLVVNYTVSGYLTGSDLASGQVQFNSGETEKQVPFTVTATQPVGGSNQDVTVTLASGVNLGERSALTVHLVVNNQAPVVSLTAAQAGVQRSAFGRADGAITITANILDPNTADTHTIEWHYPNGAVVQTADTKLTLQAESLTAGLQRFEAVVMDSGTPAATTSGILDLALRESPPVIPAGASSWAPSGLPNAPTYQPPTRNVLPERQGVLTQFLIEADPAVQLSMGSHALLSNQFQAEVSQGIPADTIANVGGVFDFIVSDLANVGQSVRIIVPQRVNIPVNPVYRKFDPTTRTWKSFATSSTDSIASAPGTEGICPSPGNAAYRTGLNPGDWCVQLTITDGGPNDGDGKANGVVSDPGGVAATAAAVVKTKGNGGGGAFNIGSLIFGFVLLWVLKLRARVIRHALFVIATLSAGAVASAQGWNGGFEVGRVQGGVSTSDLNARLQSAGYNATAEVINRNRTAWRVHGGYQWSRYFGAELGYTDFGEVRTRLTGNVVDIQDFLGGANRLSPHSAKGVEVLVNGYLPLTRFLGLHGRAGLLNWRSSYDAANQAGQFQRLHESGFDEFYGAGFEVTAWQRWSVSLDYSQYRLDHETLNIPSIGIVFRN